MKQIDSLMAGASAKQPAEYDEDGRIKRICMAKLCHQPIWVREYMEFTPTRPLLCLGCWERVYAFADCKSSLEENDSYAQRQEWIQQRIQEIL